MYILSSALLLLCSRFNCIFWWL